MSDDNMELRPGGLKLLSSRLNLAELDLHGGEGLWDEVARYGRNSDLEAQVDASMGGRAAPRIWAVMESPGAGPAAAAAALGIARILADRGQAVVLVDADENEPRITRWLGRIEMEGWIDMIRFGASLHSASEALPSDNRRGSAVGVGSFAPTGVTPDEVADLVSRLRRQADDLVIVLPAKLRSQPWLEAAHIKLLCWDLLSRSAADTEKIVVELDRMGAKPDALLGFGVEEFMAIQDRLQETDREDSLMAALDPSELETETETGTLETPEVVDPEPTVPVETEEVTAIVDEAPPLPPEDEPADELPVEPETSAEPEPESAAEPDSGPETEPVAAAEGGARRRSSGIFIFVAVAAVACLILLGVFLVGQRDGDSPGQTSPVASARMDSQSGAGTAPGQPAGGAEVSTDAEVAIADPADGLPVQDAGSQAETGTGTALPEPVVTTPAGNDPAESPVEEQPAPVAVEPEPTPAEDLTPAFDPIPFRKPVGEDGWTLWLASAPEPEVAEKEVARFSRRGVIAAYKAVEVEGKGTWYRIYSGSFSTRAEANAAADGLKTELKHDWAVPSRF